MFVHLQLLHILWVAPACKIIPYIIGMGPHLKDITYECVDTPPSKQRHRPTDHPTYSLLPPRQLPQQAACGTAGPKRTPWMAKPPNERPCQPHSSRHAAARLAFLLAGKSGHTPNALVALGNHSATQSMQALSCLTTMRPAVSYNVRLPLADIWLTEQVFYCNGHILVYNEREAKEK